VINDRVMQLLPAAGVTLRGLDRYMAEQELDLFEFTTVELAQSLPCVIRTTSSASLLHSPIIAQGGLGTLAWATTLDGVLWACRPLQK
jgi:hypothetical protein